MQITEVHVCTELSPNGSTWTQIGCATYELLLTEGGKPAHGDPGCRRARASTST